MSWQPISTVPRDGTVVDLWHREIGRLTDTWWDSADEVWACLFEDADFTHWMPVPEAPLPEADRTLQQSENT